MADDTSKRRPAQARHGQRQAATSGTEKSSSTVTKTLRILERIASSAKPTGVREMARELGFGKSTTSRILLALEREGYVEVDPDSSGYQLGNKLLHLTSYHYRNMQIHKIARPHMLVAGAQTGETVFLGVHDGWDVVVLDRVDSQQPLRMVTELGAREPAYCTGMGKVLLAYSLDLDKPDAFNGLHLRAHTRNTITDVSRLRETLRRVRREGYAFDEGEMFEEVRCVACPVYNHNGRVIAAVSVSGPAFRMGPDSLETMHSAVKSMASRISADLGNAEVLETPEQPDLERSS